MKEIRLKVSNKVHARLRRGHRARINRKHCHGSGIPYLVKPETYNRIVHAFDYNRGIDISLDQDELEATAEAEEAAEEEAAEEYPDELDASSLYGQGLAGNLRRAGKVLDFIGNKVYTPIARTVAPVAKPIIGALTNLAVTRINNTADPSARYLNAAERGVDLFKELHSTSASAPEVRVKNYLAIANAAAIQANSFHPFAAPAAPPPPPSYMVGTPTGGPIFHSLGQGLVHKGHIDAVGTPFNWNHPARRSAPHFVGMMQQLPIVFRDAARVGAGLWLS